MKKVIVLAALLISSAVLGKTELEHSQSSPLLMGEKNTKSLNTPDNYNLSLKKEALGHFFLLHASMIDNPPSATGNPLNAKVVYFKRNGNFVAMFESTSGKLVTNSVTTEILLAKFPVTYEDNTTISFNFEEGMKILFHKSSYYIGRPGSTTSDSSFKIIESFINKVELRNKHIFIEQFLRVETPGTRANSTEISPIHIKYTLSSYKKNKNFKPLVSPGFDEVGYFENFPIYPLDEQGNIVEAQVTHVKKFDINKGITFHITNNIPTKYKQAVIDGVKYWNKAFKKEVIKVETLPEGISVHEPGYNIVQWLKWDTAGFAYAASSSDPLTGEIHQAHVYMTSSFATNSYRGVKTILERLKKEESHSHVGLEGFTSAKLCGDVEHKRNADISKLKEISGALEQSKLSEEEKEIIYTRYVADYVREVVAHEVGHTLGFRHNFAASLETTVDSSNYDSIGKEYLLTGLIPSEVKVGASVMDYTPGYFSSFIGAKIRLEDSALDYDQHVIDVSYNGKNKVSETLFCTDDHAELFYDCFRFDAFSNVIEEKKFFLDDSFKKIAHRFISTHLKFLADDSINQEEKLTKAKNLTTSSKGEVSWYAKNRFKPLAMKAKKSKKSLIYRDLMQIDFIAQQNLEKIKKEFNSIGGLNKVLFQDITPTFDGTTWLSPLARISYKKFEELLPSYYPIVLEDQVLKDTLTKKFKTYMSEFDRHFLLMAIQYVDQSYSYMDENMTDAIYNLSSTVLDTKSTTLVFENSSILSPLFSEKLNGKSLRKEAIDLLKAKFFPDSFSFQRRMKRIKAKAYKGFKDFETQIISTFGEIELTSDEVYDYYMNEKALYKAIK